MSPTSRRPPPNTPAFVDVLRSTVPDVVVGATPVPGDPDAVYTFDPTLVTDAGVIPLRPGKEGRRGEPAVAAAELADAGCADPCGALRRRRPRRAAT